MYVCVCAYVYGCAWRVTDAGATVVHVYTHLRVLYKTTAIATT